jgi:hypothetical protein
MKSNIHCSPHLTLSLFERNISDKRCTEKLNTYLMIGNVFFENHATYEIMWKNIVEPDRPQWTIWRMYIACWISKATNT